MATAAAAINSPQGLPRRSRVPLGAAVVFTAILAARLAFALALPGPWFLPDEVSYLEQALMNALYRGKGGIYQWVEPQPD
jgi:hypothetical protein